MKPKLSFENFLLESHAVSADALLLAQRDALARKVSFFQAVVEKNVLSEEGLAESLAKFHEVEYRPGPLPLDMELIAQFPLFTLRRFKVIPLDRKTTQITIAATNPANFLVTDEIRRLTKLTVKIVCTTEKAIAEALERLTSDEQKTAPISKAEEASAAMRLEEIIGRSIQRGASDIHFEPQHNYALVRERIDGMLYEVERMDLSSFSPLVSRLKLLAGMDIVEKRLAQDGRFKFKHGKGHCEIRGATLPTIYGEKMVLRLLRSDKSDPTLEMLDIGLQRLATIRRICQLTDGLILIAGPTGCGKTTTLYAILSTLDRKTQNVIMVEDPVEFELELANQVQINSKIGVTFAGMLPAILRQDPDVLMVGEMRDEATTQMVMRSAISGHLVFSSIHAPTAIQTIARLLDMEVQPHMVVASLQVCLSQRLMRKLCLRCRQPKQATTEEKKLLGLKGDEIVTIYEHKGCDVCHNLGYLGRFAVMEILELDDSMREAILKRDLRLLETKARAVGFKTMQEHAAERILAGDTTLTELVANVPIGEL